MPNKPPPMKLCPEEELFLRHWMYDETHYLEGSGPAKQLQLEHEVKPAELADLIAAAIPDPVEQEAAGRTAPLGDPTWPWTVESFRIRLGEARAFLAARRR